MPKGEYLQYGGQAIIEGVMMRSPRYFSVACRAPNGEIVHQTEAIEKTWIGRQKWLKLPFLRGSLALLDSMALGIKAMRFSSGVQLDAQHQPGTGDPDEEEKAAIAISPAPSAKIQDATIIGALILGLVFGLTVFRLLPNVVSAGMTNRFHITNYMEINLVTEAVSVFLFLGYLWLIGQMGEIKRVFMYHGAEHKAINTMEMDQPLTLENCAQQTRLHPRCGTSFAIIVLFVSIVLLTFVPRPGFSLWLINAVVRFVEEIPLLAVVAGISYEALRFAGKFRDTRLVNTLFWPGLKSQYLTTREPDKTQIEVALVALQNVIEAEEKGLPEEQNVPKPQAVEA